MELASTQNFNSKGRLLLAFLCLAQSWAAKQRSWLGPDVFFEGSPPVPRDTAGVAWSRGKLYIFAGFGYNGAHFSAPVKREILSKLINRYVLPLEITLPSWFTAGDPQFFGNPSKTAMRIEKKKSKQNHDQ